MNEFDASAPNVARIYNYLLGGKDNYESDRQAAARILAIEPDSADAARQNRAFLGRVVRFLPGKRESASSLTSARACRPKATFTR